MGFLWPKVPQSCKDGRKVPREQGTPNCDKDGISSFVPSLLPENPSASQCGVQIMIRTGTQKTKGGLMPRRRAIETCTMLHGMFPSPSTEEACKAAVGYY